jgi:hypothetical protein
MLVKNRTQVIRVSSQKVMKWQPYLSMTKPHQASHSSPKLSKHTCLIAKEGRKNVKSNTSFSSKYVTSDEDTLSSHNYDSSDDDNILLSEFMKNPNAMIKGVMRQVGARDELFEQQEELLIEERKN